jgi:very-short-patch-repair endonuclease
MQYDPLISPITRLPYNPKLSDRAKDLRRNMTPAEKKFWFGVLKSNLLKNYNFLRQRIIDHYIVDFYCKKLNLVIEIDGEIHKKQVEYDKNRTDVLMNYNLIVIRFTNNEVMNNTEKVKEKLLKIMKSIQTPPLSSFPYFQPSDISPKGRHI